MVTGSVHFTSTATMALQNARQVQSIMLTHHDVEQHALVGLVHDGDGLCTLSAVSCAWVPGPMAERFILSVFWIHCCC